MSRVATRPSGATGASTRSLISETLEASMKRNKDPTLMRVKNAMGKTTYTPILAKAWDIIGVGSTDFALVQVKPVTGPAWRKPKTSNPFRRPPTAANWFTDGGT